MDWTWTNGEREDGLRIVSSDDGSVFRIDFPGCEFLICCCPCCGEPLGSLQKAQLVAERIYPFSIRTH
jgi:hypothetical protein